MPIQPNGLFQHEPDTHLYRRPTIPDSANWGHEPAHHCGSFVSPGRAVLLLPGHHWPHEPETCPIPDSSPRQWHLDNTVLTCPGCGLDET